MPRYRLDIAYDGADFCGWQRQEPPAAEAGAGAAEGPAVRAYSDATPLIESGRAGRVALRTVQGVVEAAVRAVVREPVEVLGASRTDSGVHAKGQVAAFTCAPRGDGSAEPAHAGWPLERGADRLAAAINSRLPADVLVTGARAVANDFDPVGGAVSKCYTYSFWVSPVRPLWERRTVHHIWHPGGLDAPAMQEAARALVGEHDFAAFAAAGHGRLSTVRTVHGLSVESTEAAGGRRVVIRITGSGFLWNMVRIIAGTLMQVGLGQRAPGGVRAALESRDRAKAGPTAPPTGLCLEWIRYEGEPEG